MSDLPRLDGGDDRWMAFGACRGRTDVDFFPELGDDTEPAKAVCRGCPVQRPCLEWAMDHYWAGSSVPLPGVWGGSSALQRKALRAARRRDARAAS